MPMYGCYALLAGATLSLARVLIYSLKWYLLGARCASAHKSNLIERRRKKYISILAI